MSTCRPLGPREIPRLLTPSSFTDDAGLRPKRRVSALPISHTPILMGGFISGLTYGSLSLQPVDLLAPLVGADRASTQPTGTFTSGLSTVWSPAPPPDITTETTGQFSLAGLFPLERQLASLQQALRFCSPPRPFLPLRLIAAGQPRLLRPSRTCFVASACIGYANHLPRQLVVWGLAPHEIHRVENRAPHAGFPKGSTR